MKEKLIEFKTAKLAFTKNFFKSTNINILMYEVFSLSGWREARIIETAKIINNSYKGEFRYKPSVTQSLLQQWIWETHKIWIEVTLWGDGIGFNCMAKQAKGKDDDGSTIVKIFATIDVGLACGDPQYALERGLFETLKKITI